jgi:hypothetical protein
MARSTLKIPKSIAGFVPVAVLAVLAALSVMYLRPRMEHFKWKKVADETKSFHMDKTAITRFGDGKNWVYKNVKGTIPCTNSYYGKDPSPGKLKKCEKYYA